MKEKNINKGIENVYPIMGDITQNWVDSLVPYTKDYSAKLSGSEISKLTKIPQQSVSRNLNAMVDKNILKYNMLGKNKLFYFDLKDTNTKMLFNLIENSNSMNFLYFNSEIKPIIQELLFGCETIIVFGSYAKNNANKSSDIDIVILGKTDKNYIKKIKERYPFEINEKYTNYKEFATLLNNKNALVLEIYSNHLIFGNISKIVDIFLRYRNDK